PGRDRKILVAVCLAGSQFARSGHQELATLVWAGGVSHPPSSAHADRPQIPYRGIRYQNQCYLRLLANADCGQIERITGRGGDYWMRVRSYCPWVLSTRSQALVNLGRCCCRQARIVKSP